MRDLQRDRDGGFGSFHPSQNQREPSKTAPVTAEEMNSPARETSKGKRWNMYGNGHNRPTSRHEIETWISQHCEVGFLLTVLKLIQWSNSSCLQSLLSQLFVTLKKSAVQSTLALSLITLLHLTLK